MFALRYRKLYKICKINKNVRKQFTLIISICLWMSSPPTLELNEKARCLQGSVADIRYSLDN